MSWNWSQWSDQELKKYSEKLTALAYGPETTRTKALEMWAGIGGLICLLAIIDVLDRGLRFYTAGVFLAAATGPWFEYQHRREKKLRIEQLNSVRTELERRTVRQPT